MAEITALKEGEDNEALLSKARTDIKELRGKIQSLKKAVPKGDKKRKREAAAEIAKLELELAKLEEFKAKLDVPSVQEDAVTGISEDVAVVQDQLEGVALSEVGVASGGKKKSKAQRRKDKKSAADKEREERIASGESESAANNPRLIEREQLSTALTPLGLVIKDVPADGHCLYAAMSDQLSCRGGVKASVTELRSQCSEYIQSHSDDFLPYLVDPNTGDQFTKDKFSEYCEEIAQTAAWGGQMEIQALSHVYKVPVMVYQATAPPLTIGDGYTGTALTLAYHHHEYGLGEHYNSIIPDS